MRHEHVYFPAYEKGFLLEEGGLADQPAKYVDYMVFIERVEGAVKEKYREIVGAQNGDPPQGDGAAQ